jgi:hypothetical protein
MRYTMKKVSIAIMAVAIAAIMCFPIFSLPPKLYADPYAIGDTGPAGGIIFYIDGSNYLEAAPSDQGSYGYWSIAFSSLIGTTGIAIGTGQSNTNDIIAQGAAISAAKLCADYELNGYDDWFLPSKDELNLMYEKLYLAGLGGFSLYSTYWSSSEYDENQAWYQRFNDGWQSPYSKDDHSSARAIRAFTLATTPSIEPVWVRDREMTCKRVWIEDGKFRFSFIYPYADNNWVKIYDMTGKLVYEVDMPYDNPNIIVDLPDGMYTVKTFNDQPEPIQTFIIGKP